MDLIITMGWDGGGGGGANDTKECDEIYFAMKLLPFFSPISFFERITRTSCGFLFLLL